MMVAQLVIASSRERAIIREAEWIASSLRSSQ